MYKFTLVLILSLIAFCSYTQEKEYSQFDIDTIVFLEVDLKETARFKDILSSNSSFYGWTKYYAYKSFAFIKLRENDSVLKYADLAIDTYNNKELQFEELKTSVSKAYYLKGLVDFYNEHYLSSLNFFYQSLIYAEGDTGIDSWNDYILQQIIGIHNSNENFTYALKYALKLLNSENIIKHRYECSKMYYDVGILYSFINVKDSSQYYFNIAKHSFYNTDKVYNKNISQYANQSLINSIYNYLGETHYNNGNLDSAKIYFNNAKNIYDEFLIDKDSLNFANNTAYLQSKINYGLLLYLEGSTAKSKTYLESIKEEILSLDTYLRIERKLISNFYDYLNLVYNELMLLTESNSVKNEYIEYLSRYIEHNNSKQIQRLSTEYYVSEKENEISSLKIIKENQEVIIRQRNLINWIVFGFVLLVGIVVYNINRKLKLKNDFKAVILEQKLLRSQLNPHFVFNIINNIQVLENSQSVLLSDYLRSFSNLLRLTLENSREEYVFLKKELSAVKSYLELSSKFSKTFNFSIDIDKSIDVENTLVPPMFIQPLVENSIYHGLLGIADGMINIQITKNSDSTIKIIILDNGVGYKIDKKNEFKNSFYKSVSGEVLKERLKIYSKVFNTDLYLSTFNRKDNESGTEVELLLPYLIEKI